MAKSEGINKNSIVTTSELAGIMGLSPRRLQQLVKAGILYTVEEGRFYLGEAVQAYNLYVKGGGEKSEEEKKLDLRKKRAEVELKEARAKVEKLKAAELDGEMFRREDIEVLTNDYVFTAKALIMNMPPRLAVDVAAENNPAMCGEIIKRECRYILREISQYEFDPEKYMERVRERRKMELKFMQETEEED